MCFDVFATQLMLTPNVNPQLAYFLFLFKLLLNTQKQVPTPGIEPGPPAWKAGILTTRPYGRTEITWGIAATYINYAMVTHNSCIEQLSMNCTHDVLCDGVEKGRSVCKKRCSTRPVDINKRMSHSNIQKTTSSLGGLEPPTFRLTAERANRLRHRDYICTTQSYMSLVFD